MAVRRHTATIVHNFPSQFRGRNCAQPGLNGYNLVMTDAANIEKEIIKLKITHASRAQ